MDLDPGGITAAGSQPPVCSGKRETFLKGFVAEKAGDQLLEKDKKEGVQKNCPVWLQHSSCRSEKRSVVNNICALEN